MSAQSTMVLTATYLHSSPPLPVMQCSRWPQPDASVGLPHAALDILGRYKCWSLKDKSPAHGAWKSISKSIHSLLEDLFEHLDAGDSELTIEMFMVGRKTTKSSPTILFSCESKVCRQKAMELVQKKGLLENHPGVLMAECSRLPRLLAPGEDSIHPLLPPGVYLNGPPRGYGVAVLIYMEGQKLPRKATIGGLVLIGGEVFGFTAGHAFTQIEERHNSGNEEYGLEFFGAGDPYDSLDSEDEFVTATSQASMSSESSQLSSMDDLEYKRVSYGANQAPQISPIGHGNTMLYTATSLRVVDVGFSDDFITDGCLSNDFQHFPSSAAGTVEFNTMSGQEMLAFFNHQTALATGNQESSTSNSEEVEAMDYITFPTERTAAALRPNAPSGYVKLGTMFESSTIGDKLDWALVKIEYSTALPQAQILDLNMSILWENTVLSPSTTIGIESDSPVLILTGSDGIVPGEISAITSFTINSKLQSFGRFFTVRRISGSFNDGDCGSWVFDRASGSVYGHVVSGFPGTGIAYLVPSVDCFRNIQLRCRHPVELLSARNKYKVHGFHDSRNHPLDEPILVLNLPIDGQNNFTMPEDPVLSNSTVEGNSDPTYGQGIQQGSARNAHLSDLHYTMNAGALYKDSGLLVDGDAELYREVTRTGSSLHRSSSAPMGIPKMLPASKPAKIGECIQCKTRRVKCDQSRPHCLKCKRSGRFCEYPIDSKSASRPAQAKSAMELLGARQLRSMRASGSVFDPQSSIHATEYEYQYFKVFAQRAAYQLSGYLTSGLWTQLIRQEIYQLPAIRYSTIALGALIEASDLRSGFLRVDGIQSWNAHSDQAALFHHKAIRELRCYISTSKKPQLRHALIACLLFICFQTFQSNDAFRIQWTCASLDLLQDHEVPGFETGIRQSKIHQHSAEAPSHLEKDDSSSTSEDENLSSNRATTNPQATERWVSKMGTIHEAGPSQRGPSASQVYKPPVAVSFEKQYLTSEKKRWNTPASSELHVSPGLTWNAGESPMFYDPQNSSTKSKFDSTATSLPVSTLVNSNFIAMNTSPIVDMHHSPQEPVDIFSQIPVQLWGNDLRVGGPIIQSFLRLVSSEYFYGLSSFILPRWNIRFLRYRLISIPSQFLDLFSARQCWDFLMNECLRICYQSLLDFSASSAFVATKKDHRSRNIQKLSAFEDAFQPLLAEARDSSSRVIDRAPLVISLQVKATSILLSCSATDSEMTYDNFLSSFKYTTETCLTIINSDPPLNSPYDKRFSLEIEIIPPLFLTATKCRDPVVRREAIDLLSSSRRQEGLWDSMIMGRIGRWIVQCEEEGLSPPPLTKLSPTAPMTTPGSPSKLLPLDSLKHIFSPTPWIVPEANRVRLTAIDYDATGRQIKVRYQRAFRNQDGTKAEHEDIIKWDDQELFDMCLEKDSEVEL